MGKEAMLAAAVGAVLKAGQAPNPETSPLPSGRLDAKSLQAILGAEAQTTDGKIYKFTFEKKTQMAGEDIGKAMGVSTWAAFAGSAQDAVVDVDFAMLETDLQGVIKTLRRNGLSVVAIHNHMIMETPRIMFLHYWGRGSAESLARAVKSALDSQTR
jgi:hypothetical protein